MHLPSSSTLPQGQSLRQEPAGTGRRGLVACMRVQHARWCARTAGSAGGGAGALTPGAALLGQRAGGEGRAAEAGLGAVGGDEAAEDGRAVDLGADCGGKAGRRGFGDRCWLLAPLFSSMLACWGCSGVQVCKYLGAAWGAWETWAASGEGETEGSGAEGSGAEGEGEGAAGTGTGEGWTARWAAGRAAAAGCRRCRRCRTCSGRCAMPCP
jgi:hypothetical protein